MYRLAIKRAEKNESAKDTGTKVEHVS